MKRIEPLLAALVLTSMAFLVYAPSIGGGFVWDDGVYIERNRDMGSVAGLGRIWLRPGGSRQYYPLLLTVFWVEHAMWGMSPLGYRVVNVLLHASNALLLWCLLKRLKAPGAWLAALLFVVHPVHVESVAWVSEMKNTLSAFFFLSALVVYFGPATEASASISGRRLLAVILLYVCALLSKTATASFPLALLLAVWWKDGTVSKRVWTLVGVMMLPALLLGGVSLVVEVSRYGGDAVATLSWPEKLILGGRSVWFYARKLFVPNGLVLVYPKWQIDAASVLQWLYPVCIVACLGVLWASRARIGRGAFACVAFYVGSLVPLSLMNINYFVEHSYVADHFQYLPSMALLALVAGALDRVLAAQSAGRWLRAAVAAVLCLGLGSMSWAYSGSFASEEVLWRRVLAVNPNSWTAHNNLGLILERGGYDEEAEEHYRAALDVNSQYVAAMINLAGCCGRRGESGEAVSLYRRAVSVRPGSAEAHSDLGVELLLLGCREEALDHLREAVRLMPDGGSAHYNLGRAYLELRRYDEALEVLLAAADLLRSAPDVQNALGVALAGLGRPEEARARYRRALELAPDYAPARANLELLEKDLAGPSEDGNRRK